MENWMTIVLAVLLAVGLAITSALVTEHISRRRLKSEIKLVAVKIEKGYIALLWNDEGNPEQLPLKYAVFRKTAASNSFEQIAITTNTSFVDAPDTLDVQYTYLIVEYERAQIGQLNRVSNRVQYTP